MAHLWSSIPRRLPNIEPRGVKFRPRRDIYPILSSLCKKPPAPGGSDLNDPSIGLPSRRSPGSKACDRMSGITSMADLAQRAGLHFAIMSDYKPDIAFRASRLCSLLRKNSQLRAARSRSSLALVNPMSEASSAESTASVASDSFFCRRSKSALCANP